MKTAALSMVIALPGLAASDVATKPPSPHHMLYDASSRRLVLLTASNRSGLQELWKWDGKTWTLVPGSGPAARELSGAAYDTRRQRVVLFGGSGAKGTQGRMEDTWEWDGVRWQQIAVAGPGQRDHHAMAYDAARGKTVLFGGLKAENVLDADTWEWDGARWARMAAQGPGGGGAHLGMAYDGLRKKVILFGGMDRSGKPHNETWAWDGKAWERLAVGGPAPRYRHRMAFDSSAGVIVLFGGLLAKRAPASVGDTWIWDGQRWEEVRPSGGASPPPRNSHVMAYDAVRRRTVLFGGSSFDGKVVTNYSDTWEWDGHNWTRAN